ASGAGEGSETGEGSGAGEASETGEASGRALSAVLTCPAGWGAPRRRVLFEAAARAGLENVTLVSEPIAEAAYFSSAVRPDLPPRAALAIVDLGAGTTDVAVVRYGDDDHAGGPPEVVAQGGLEVGGIDVDAALLEHLGAVVRAAAPEVWRRLTAPKTS